MADEWIGITKAAAPKYLKGAIDLTIRKRLVLSMMERRGLITLNYLGSHEEKYDVDWKEPPVESYADGGIVEYARRDYLKQATIDWRGYVATDLMTLKEQEMTKGGDYVLVNRYKRILPKLTKGVRNQIGLEFYVDGGAAGNENRFCGIETFCGANTSYDSVGADVADLVAQPHDSYNGLDTDLNQGGRWSSDLTTSPNANVATDWPEGEGSSEYDYWSPKLVNVGSTSWDPDGSDASWALNAERVLRRTNQWMMQTAGMNGMTLLALVSGDWMTQFKDLMSTKQRVLTPHKESEDLGFPETLNFEGVGIKSEFGIAASRGYVFNVDELEMCILPDELIKSKGPDYDPDSMSYKFAVYTFGNFKWLPKHVAKLYTYAAS